MINKLVYNDIIPCYNKTGPLDILTIGNIRIIQKKRIINVCLIWIIDFDKYRKWQKKDQII